MTIHNNCKKIPFNLLDKIQIFLFLILLTSFYIYMELPYLHNKITK